MQAKTLPKLPLYQISLNGTPYTFTRYRHTQTRVAKMVRDRQHCQMLAAYPTGIRKHLFKLGRFQQPQLSRKAPGRLIPSGTTGRLLQLSGFRR